MQIKWWYFLALGVLAIDLITKAVFDGKTIDLIAGVIGINGFVHNTGASGGFLGGWSGAMTFFIILSFVFLIGMIAFDILFKKKFGANAWYKVGFTLVLGGLLGNLIDRLAFGYVRDFIELEFIQFPVFNIADVALTIGCICLAVFLVFYCKFGGEKNMDKKHQKIEDKINKNNNLVVDVIEKTEEKDENKIEQNEDILEKRDESTVEEKNNKKL
ncbi:MAG: signal peptidase II [Clostridia bacterium]|nr:signal peptidase II [Clostridia bacterium]